MERVSCRAVPFTGRSGACLPCPTPYFGRGDPGVPAELLISCFRKLVARHRRACTGRLLTCRPRCLQYEKVAKCGEGTYGVVFRARDQLTGRSVALKQIRCVAHWQCRGLPGALVEQSDQKTGRPRVGGERQWQGWVCCVLSGRAGVGR
jgi:hypothetical protein